jgi:hypothetical protein
MMDNTSKFAKSVGKIKDLLNYGGPKPPKKGLLSCKCKKGAKNCKCKKGGGTCNCHGS